MQTSSRTRLTIRHFWRGRAVASNTFGPGHPPLTVGSGTRSGWRLLGIDMGALARPLRVPFSLLGPLGVEVDTRSRHTFFAPEEHPLVRWEFGHHVLVIPEGAALHLDGVPIEPSAALATGLVEAHGDELLLPLTGHGRLRMTVGESLFHFDLAEPPAAPPRAAWDEHDVALFILVGMLSALGALLALVIALSPRPASAMVTPDLLPVTTRLAAPPKPPKTEEPPTPKERPERVGAQRAKAPKLSPAGEARGGAGDPAPSGILGELQRSGVGSFGSASLLTARVGTVAAGGPIGRGGGLVSGGPLGHGVAEGSGDLALSGTYKTGGVPSIGPKTRRPPEIQTPPVVLGGLGRQVIDDVVKRHLNQIRYCYQRQLQRTPELGGSVVVKFSIGPDGSVNHAATRSSTLQHPDVESCIAGRVLRMRFPAPNGGGRVIVTYPFAFSSR